MKKPKPHDEFPPVLTLEGELTIYRAAELKPLLLSDPPPRSIDLSGVTEIDTAGVQLLMQAKKMALQSHQSFQLLAPSHAVAEVFELLNIFSFFEASNEGGTHESR
jgi:anti-anti-sigma factor